MWNIDAVEGLIIEFYAYLKVGTVGSIFVYGIHISKLCLRIFFSNDQWHMMSTLTLQK